MGLFSFKELHDVMHIGIIDVVVRVGLALATTFLFGIVFLAYLRLKNRKMLFISAGFGVLVIYALVALPELFNDAYAIAFDENMHLLIHLVALIFILLGILKD